MASKTLYAFNHTFVVGQGGMSLYGSVSDTKVVFRVLLRTVSEERDSSMSSTWQVRSCHLRILLFRSLLEEQSFEGNLLCYVASKLFKITCVPYPILKMVVLLSKTCVLTCSKSTQVIPRFWSSKSLQLRRLAFCLYSESCLRHRSACVTDRPPLDAWFYHDVLHRIQFSIH